MRSGKNPFTVLSPETTLAQDVLHGNVGNHLYSHAVFKTLLAPGREIVSNSNLSETRGDSTRLRAGQRTVRGLRGAIGQCLSPGLSRALGELDDPLPQWRNESTRCGHQAQTVPSPGARQHSPLVTHVVQGLRTGVERVDSGAFHDRSVEVDGPLGLVETARV
jgi:hypothetical protein